MFEFVVEFAIAGYVETRSMGGYDTPQAAEKAAKKMIRKWLSLEPELVVVETEIRAA